MSVAGGRVRMDMAIKDLRIRWNHVAERWNDPVSRAFEQNYLDALDSAARIAGGALDKMRHVIDRAQQECSDSG